MWFPFWRSRDRFSLSELRYLTDQLLKVQIVNEVNKDFVIEALRSIAELITYGDQHDPTFFEFFMERQVMGEFVRLLNLSRTVTVSLQLLQTVSIMIQNLKNEHAIYYMFSNEHINYLITYNFDFRNEELLSYYMSFLRAISGNLNKNTISLLVKTQYDEIVSFPLYSEAIRFAFHEENMIRTAVRALTLNVYHVGDECVNRYVASTPHADYFSNLVKFFQKQCIELSGLVSNSSENLGPESTSGILSVVDDIEDDLYYFSDVISAGIPDVGKLIADNILQLLIFPLLLPSLRMDTVNGPQIGAVTSFYLLCCILRIVKIKDLANTIAAALFCSVEGFTPFIEAKLNGFISGHGFTHRYQLPDNDSSSMEVDSGSLRVGMTSWSTSQIHPEDGISQQNHSNSCLDLREVLLSYVTVGNDVQVFGSLSVLATLLQTKELDESMLDALGILPQRKQHKKLLLQALVGEGVGEEQLFSSGSSFARDGIASELDVCLQKLKEEYGVSCSCMEVRASPRMHRFQVLDALVNLFCRSNISAETLWHGGWLLRQLLPYCVTEFNNHHVKLLNDSFKNCTTCLLQEVRGVWPDLLITILCDEWKKCKRAIEASSPQKELKCILLLSQKSSFDEVDPCESSFIAGERMCEKVKVFILLLQIQIFTHGRTLPDQPPVGPPINISTNSRAKAAGLDVLGPKPGTELKLDDAVPCRIAFERGKERHFYFLAASIGSSGWVILADELPLKQHYGVVRVAAPLAGCNNR
ncbi:protein TRANSPARENT TESTA 9 isoform X2 [Malania oleifera]|uniref:protein TRANSPARENT TESTA 9 isoform X2 n=1 Tax=Malania oleifera TaxID=397392 RepID=UPI0025AE4136|nr:protein TRANSPARENT TESTA 9 isoform X2 [Malania oleifera]